MAYDIHKHPCFSDSCSGSVGRIHLPVAPKCNVQCNFCNRKYDCVNESRPGVTSGVLTPAQALAYLGQAMELRPEIGVVGIAGPGDPLANPAETLATLRGVRQQWPEMLLCVASNGLEVAPYADALAAVDVTHVTLTISAVDPDIAGSIYNWVRTGKRIYRGRAAGELMLRRQLDAVRAIKARDILLKINAIIIPGVNDHHVEAVAEAMAAEGADILNCMGLCSVAGTPFGEITPPSEERLAEIRAKAEAHMPQMRHCRRCRADAAGLLDEGLPEQLRCCLSKAALGPLDPTQDRPHVAVATREGALVNLHLGEAETLSIYTRDESGVRLIDRRPAPPRGLGDDRWTQLAETLGDCQALLCSGAGPKPTEILSRAGLRVAVMEGLIDQGVQAICDRLPIRAPLREHTCGVGCAGDGAGCG